MISSVNQIQQLVEDTSAVVERYLPGKEFQDIRQELANHFEEKTLQIMLYGAYNAGKSTLINVLLGSERAPVNDIPTTFRVDSYDWHGIRLLDTPGVNAPVEHEVATDAQVKRSGLMLFVIREGDQDSKDLYQRLFDMLKRKKKVFIVLNHQLSSEEDKQVARQKILSILIALASDYGVNDEAVSDILVYPVNLKTALLAELKGSEKLLDHSGYVDFISGFEQWVTLHDHETQRIVTLQNQVHDLWLEPAHKQAVSEPGTDEFSQLNQLQHNRLILDREKRTSLNSAFSFIRQEVNLVKANVHNVLTTSQNQADVDSQLHVIFSTVTSKTESWLREQFEEMNGRLAVGIIQSVNCEHGDASPNICADVAMDGAKHVLTDKDNLFEMLKFGRKLKIPGLKGRWEKTMGSWAGKGAVLFQVASTLYDAYKSGAEEDRENQKKRQLSIEINQAVEQVCSTLTQQIHTSVTELIERAFTDRISLVQIEIDELVSQQDFLNKNIEKMSRAMSTLKS